MKTSEASIVCYSNIKETQTINPEHSLSKADDEKYGMSFSDLILKRQKYVKAEEKCWKAERSRGHFILEFLASPGSKRA